MFLTSFHSFILSILGTHHLKPHTKLMTTFLHCVYHYSSSLVFSGSGLFKYPKSCFSFSVFLFVHFVIKKCINLPPSCLPCRSSLDRQNSFPPCRENGFEPVKLFIRFFIQIVWFLFEDPWIAVSLFLKATSLNVGYTIITSHSFNKFLINF